MHGMVWVPHSLSPQVHPSCKLNGQRSSYSFSGHWFRHLSSDHTEARRVCLMSWLACKVVTDNRSVSPTMSLKMLCSGIKHITTSYYSTTLNRLVDRAVQTIKLALIKTADKEAIGTVPIAMSCLTAQVEYWDNTTVANHYIFSVYMPTCIHTLQKEPWTKPRCQ